MLVVPGEHDVEIELEEDDEELFELASLPNGDVSSDAEGCQSEQAEIIDANENDAVRRQTGDTIDPQRAIIEDIRLVLFQHFQLSVLCVIIITVVLF